MAEGREALAEDCRRNIQDRGLLTRRSVGLPALQSSLLRFRHYSDLTLKRQKGKSYGL